MPRLPGPASSPPSVQRFSTSSFLLALLIATHPLQVSSQPEAGDAGFYGDNGQTAADLEMLTALLDNLGEGQLEALEPQLRRLYSGHLLNSRVTRRGGYDPDVNRMARVIKKSGNRPAALYEDNITTTKKGDYDNLVARIIKRGDMDNLVARIIKKGGGDMDNLVARIIKKDYGMDSPWHVVDRLEKRGSKRRQDDVYLPMTDIRMRRSGGPLTMTDIRMKKRGSSLRSGHVWKKKGGLPMTDIRMKRGTTRPEERTPKRSNYLRLGFNPEGQDEGGEFRKRTSKRSNYLRLGFNPEGQDEGGEFRKRTSKRSVQPHSASAWLPLKRNNYLRLGFNPESQEEGGEFGFRRRK